MGHCECEQAHVCTTTRAKKVVVGLTLVTLVIQAISIAYAFLSNADYNAERVKSIMFRLVVPVAVLIINAIVVREVCRRVSSDAASNLGVQHHQSTSSNSAVPTVMLVTTSLVYALIHGTLFVAFEVHAVLKIDLGEFFGFTGFMAYFTFAYNFYVYLITGKQFRAEVIKLCRCCCCRTSSSSSAAATVTSATNADVQLARRGQADTAV